MGTIEVPEKYAPLIDSSNNYIGLMGISVGKQTFLNPAVMNAYSSFMQERFLYGVLIIADLPKRYNIMAFEQVAEESAQRRVITAGNSLNAFLEKITRDNPFVKSARWRHFTGDKYQSNLYNLRKAYTINTEFRDNTLDLANEFLESVKHRWVSDRKPSLDHTKEYILDELALLLAAPFAFPLPVCEIYPGRNELHEKLQSRQFTFCDKLHIKDDRVFMEAYYVH